MKCKKCILVTLLPNTYILAAGKKLDDDFKVGGVQMSTLLCVKVPRAQFVAYSCPFPLKMERDERSRHETKKLTE